MEEREDVVVIDRRGQKKEQDEEPRAEGPLPAVGPPKAEQPASSGGPLPAPGIPVRFQCGGCSSDYSEYCLVLHLGANIAFATPLICPHCGRPTAFKQRVSPVRIG